MLDEATLARHLEEMGWEVEPHGPRTFRSVHALPAGDVIVYVRLTDHWLIASVVPFLTTRGQNSFELARWLLRQNRDMVLAKFAYDEDGDVVLTLEMPIESLDFSELSASLNSLVEHTVEHRATLREASTPAHS